MDSEEIEILNKLYDESHLVFSPEKIMVSREFYDFIQDILALGYVEDFLSVKNDKSNKMEDLD